MVTGRKFALCDTLEAGLEAALELEGKGGGTAPGPRTQSTPGQAAGSGDGSTGSAGWLALLGSFMSMQNASGLCAVLGSYKKRRWVASTWRRCKLALGVTKPSDFCSHWDTQRQAANSVHLKRNVDVQFVADLAAVFPSRRRCGSGARHTPRMQADRLRVAVTRVVKALTDTGSATGSEPVGAEGDDLGGAVLCPELQELGWTFLAAVVQDGGLLLSATQRDSVVRAAVPVLREYPHGAAHPSRVTPSVLKTLRSVCEQQGSARGTAWDAVKAGVDALLAGCDNQGQGQIAYQALVQALDARITAALPAGAAALPAGPT